MLGSKHLKLKDTNSLIKSLLAAIIIDDDFEEDDSNDTRTEIPKDTPGDKDTLSQDQTPSQAEQKIKETPKVIKVP